MHPNLCAVYAAHMLYSAILSIQLQYCSLPFLISFSRLLIIVLQIMVLSETVVVLVIHKACQVKLPLISIIRGLCPVFLSCLKLILTTFFAMLNEMLRYWPTVEGVNTVIRPLAPPTSLRDQFWIQNEIQNAICFFLICSVLGIIRTIEARKNSINCFREITPSQRKLSLSQLYLELAPSNFSSA